MLVESSRSSRCCKCILLVILIIAYGCSYGPEKKELSFNKYVNPDRVLVLLLPPIAGRGLQYERNGFVDAVRERGFEVDLKVVDVNPILYLQGKIVEVLKNELIDPAMASGYARILLVGISLGGHGALLYVTQSAQDIDGVVLLAPFIGGFVIDESIKKAGGLTQWENCPSIEWNYACDMWNLIKSYLSVPDNKDKVVIGFGSEDGFADSNQLLAEQLPPNNVFKITGGHNWATWKRLWIKVLDHYHISCTGTNPAYCPIDVRGGHDGM